MDQKAWRPTAHKHKKKNKPGYLESQYNDIWGESILLLL